MSRTFRNWDTEKPSSKRYGIHIENLQKLRNWETELKNLSYKEKNPETEKGRNQSQEDIIYREYPETEKPRNQAQEVTLHKDSSETEQPRNQAP